MKLSPRLFVGFVSVVSFVIGVQGRTLAQETPTPTQETPTPETAPTRNLDNVPSTDLPFITDENTIVIPSDAQSMTVGEVVSLSPSFELLNSLLQVSGQQEESDLVNEIKNEDDFYRVYAPTDQAFAALPVGTVKLLVQPENRDLLQQILDYHVRQLEDDEQERLALGTSPYDQYSPLSEEPGMAGQQELDAETAQELGTYNARVVGRPIRVGNGIIYPINRLLIPPEVQSQLN